MLSEEIINRLKALIKRRLTDRSPIYVDIFSQPTKTIATTHSEVLVSDIDCSQFALALLYAEMTFGASANKDVYIDLRARPPGRSDYSSEPYARMVMAYNTSSPYKRYFWLPVDIRHVDMLSLYISQTSAAAASTLNHLGLRLVV